MDAIDLCEDEVEQPSQQNDDAVWILDDDDINEAARAAPSAAANASPSAAAGLESTGVYVLDCGCQERHDSLAMKLLTQAEGLQLGQTAGSIAEAVGSLSCSCCGTLLSAQDVWKLLGFETTSRLYAAVAGHVKQAALAQQGQADEQSPMAQAAAIAAVCCELWGELAALQALLLGGDPPAATPATASARRQPQRGKAAQKQPKAAAKPKAKPKPKNFSYLNHSSGNSSAWAAGTGFGGSTGITKAAQEAMSAAARKQAAVDTAMTAHLQAITAILQDPVPTAPASAADPSAAGPSTSRKRGRSDRRLYSGLPWPLCGVVLAGPLAWLLRLLYQNDSLMDVLGRAELYSAAMELMRHVGSSTDVLPLLQLPVDDPRDATPAAHTTAAGPSSSSSSSTLMSTLRRLDQQAKLYQRSAEQLMGEDDGEADDEDTTAAVCLALDLSSMVQTLEEGLNLWTRTLGQVGSLTIKPISAAADTHQQAAQAAAAVASADKSGGGSGSKRRGRGAAAASPSAAPAAPDPAVAAAAAQAQQYLSAMQPYRFIEADLLGAGHYFARDAADSSRKAAGGEVMRKRLKRITEELGALSTSLPLSWDSSILLAVHADRLDVLRALLLPHPDTPYGGGSFLFDIFLPTDYPDKPPKVQFLTTGEGRWRANPNLYDCGKVCLSLLGTWSGPSWEPGVSTLLQVLVSLQSMVFVSDPFYNEPGWERQAGTASGRAQAGQYNAGIRLGTATHAILAQLRKPDLVFGEAVKLHYSHQGERVSALLQQWARETKHNKSELQAIVKQVQQEIRKLPPPPAEPQQQEVEPEGVSRPQGSGRSARGRGRQQQPAEVCVADTDVVDLT